MRKIIYFSILLSLPVVTLADDGFYKSYSSGGQHLSIKAKNNGEDLVLPNGFRFINVTIADGAWARIIKLPARAEPGDFVKINRMSAWDSFVSTETYQIPVKKNSVSEFSFDGYKWVPLTDTYKVVPNNKTQKLILPDGYKHILVSTYDGAWGKKIQLPEKPDKGSVVTLQHGSTWDVIVSGRGISQKTNKQNTVTYTFNGKEWKSSLGNVFEIFPDKLQSNIEIPSDKENIVVNMKNGSWSKNVIFPGNSKLGSNVIINRTSDYDVYAVLGRENVLIPASSSSQFRWDGNEWKNVSIKTQGIIRVKDSGYYNVKLTNAVSGIVKSEMAKVSNIRRLTTPASVVDLKDMKITGDTFYNNTPYSVDGVYIESNSEVKLLQFNATVPKYSSAYIGYQYNTSKIISTSTLGNNKYAFKEPYEVQDKKVTHANGEERESVERVQMYERFWLNAPFTIDEIMGQIDRECDSNQGYSECKNYNESKLDYVADMYFAQSVSGMTTRFWISPDVWGLATMPKKSIFSTVSSHTVDLWMSPKLMKNMLSQNSDIAIDAEQGLVHEYYHNLGFSHNSGWASSNGIDDLFGVKAVKEYRSKLENRYIIPDIAVDYKKTKRMTYLFTLNAVNNIDDLTLRLLSTDKLSAKISDHKNGQIEIAFDSIPNSEVYVSFFTGKSAQMSTVKLTDFVTFVETQEELSNLSKNINNLLSSYDKLLVRTKNGAWIKDVYLPDTVESGKLFTFTSKASFSSYIHYNNTTLKVNTGDTVNLEFTGGRWTIK